MSAVIDGYFKDPQFVDEKRTCEKADDAHLMHAMRLIAEHEVVSSLHALHASTYLSTSA